MTTPTDTKTDVAAAPKLAVAPRVRRPRPAVMSVTPLAVEKVKTLIESRGKPTAGIRIGVRSKGCSGMSYTLEFADRQEPMDEVVESGGVKLLIDHYENPRNIGSLDKGSDDVGTGLVGAPACGDVMKLQIKVGPDGLIEDAKFKTFGCGSAIASSSLATEMIKGMTLDQAATIKNTDIAKHLALPPVKIHCSVLAEDAIKAAIADYRAKMAQKDIKKVEAAE